MSGKLTKAQTDEAIRKLTHGHTDLTVFYSVISTLEGGHLHDQHSHRAAARIIRICQAEGARLLRMYDAGRAALITDTQQGAET